MSYQDVNAKIASQLPALETKTPGTYPATINLSQTTSGSPPITITVRGNASPWQLVAGGSQSSAMLGIQITNATLSNGTATFSGTVGITISGQLQVSAANVITIVKPTGAGSPYTIDYSGLDSTPTSLEATEFNLVLHAWLDTLWPLFGTVLMTIDPEIQYPTGWDWLTPNSSRAIVLESVGGTVSDFQFIIVSMTRSNPPPSAVVISGSLIPPGSQMGFAMAPGPFLDNVIRLGMDKTFLATAPGKFSVTNQKLTAAQPIIVNQFQIDTTHTVKATFSQVELSIEGQRLVFRAHVAFPYQEGTVQAVDVNLDLELDYGLSLTRTSITTADGQTISDFPLIQLTDDGNFQMTNLTVEASGDFSLWQWLAPLIGSLVVAIAAAGIGIYKGRSDWNEYQASRAGNSAMRMNPVGGKLAAGNQAAAGAQAAGAAGGGPRPPVMWGALPRSTVLSLIGLTAGWLVGTGLSAIPFWIVLVQTGHATDLVKGNMDAAISKLLQTYKLPDAAGEDMKVASVSLNNCLLIGANP